MNDFNVINNLVDAKAVLLTFKVGNNWLNNHLSVQKVKVVHDEVKRFGGIERFNYNMDMLNREDLLIIH